MKLITAGMLLLFALFASPRTSAQEYRWIHQDSIPNCIYYDITCHDGNTCVAIGNAGGLRMIVRRSTDGGITWNRIYFDSAKIFDSIHSYLPLHLNRVAQPSPDHILIACDSGRILHTEDAGAHWGIVQTESGEMIDCISMADTLNGIAGGNASGVLATTDGGLAWTRVPKPDTISRKGTLDMICFAPNVYLVLTNSQDIIRTEDGGMHWRFNRGPTDCVRIAFISREVGWAAGNAQTGAGSQARDIIRVTRDSGATWQTQVDSLIPFWFGLNDIAFTDSLNGVAVGQAGKVLRTTDGGRTWLQEQVNLTAQLIAVAYPTPTTALIVSNEGNILKQERVITGVNEQRSMAGTTELRVIPNPAAGDDGEIRYTVRAAGTARLTMSDMLGRSRMLIDDPMQIAGEHAAPLPAGLPSGIYIVRLQSGAAVTTTTCIVRR